MLPLPSVYQMPILPLPQGSSSCLRPRNVSFSKLLQVLSYATYSKLSTARNTVLFSPLAYCNGNHHMLFHKHVWPMGTTLDFATYLDTFTSSMTSHSLMPITYVDGWSNKFQKECDVTGRDWLSFTCMDGMDNSYN